MHYLSMESLASPNKIVSNRQLTFLEKEHASCSREHFSKCNCWNAAGHGVLVCVLWRNRTNSIQNIFIFTNINEIIYIYVCVCVCVFIIGFGLCDCGSQEVLQSAICKLETQKTWWYNSVKVQSPEKWEHQCLRAEEDRYLSSGRKQINSFFTFGFYLGPKYIGWCQPALLRNIFFTQFTVSNANFFRGTLIDTPINNVLQILGIP